MAPAHAWLGLNQLRATALPAALPAASERTSAESNDLRRLTETRICATLVAMGGNVSEAVRRLGISRNTLYRWVR